MESIKKIKGYLITAVITAIIAIVCSTILAIRVHNSNPNYMKYYSYEVYRDKIELHYQGVKDALVDAVDHYIDSIAPSSCLNGIKVVEICDQYEFDIMFALAQGQLESHFGTEGIAAKTNMVWNVGAFDNKSAEDIINDKNKNTAISHPDKSIEPYIRLLYSTYLVDGKTEKDMFIKYVDKNGKRYASNPNYESSLLDVYERIKKETNIDELIMEFKKYKIITGK